MNKYEENNPDAITKLEGELADARAWGEIVKAWNARVRKAAKARAKSLGHELTHTEHQLLVEDFHRLGFEGEQMPEVVYKGLKSQAFAFPWLPQLGTDAANARRIEKRIEKLKQRDADPERETIEGRVLHTINEGEMTKISSIEFKLEDNKAANRTQIWFGGLPPKELREALKGRGFKWAPSGGVWQRMRSNGAWYVAKQILGVP